MASDTRTTIQLLRDAGNWLDSESGAAFHARADYIEALMARYCPGNDHAREWLNAANDPPSGAAPTSPPCAVEGCTSPAVASVCATCLGGPVTSGGYLGERGAMQIPLSTTAAPASVEMPAASPRDTSRPVVGYIAKNRSQRCKPCAESKLGEPVVDGGPTRYKCLDCGAWFGIAAAPTGEQATAPACKETSDGE